MTPLAAYAQDQNGNRLCRNCYQNYCRRIRTVKKNKIEIINISNRENQIDENLNSSPNNEEIPVLPSVELFHPDPVIDDQDDETVGIDSFFGDEELRDRYLVASFCANNGVSFNGAEGVSEELFSLNKMKQVKRNTIIRATAELAIVCDFVVGELLLNSEELGLGFDEASKSDGRSHLEVEIFGKFKENNEHWYMSRMVLFFF
jgi:hypothetical protein